MILRNKVVVIVGGSQDIGYALAARILKEHARFIVISKDKSRAE